MNKSVVICAGLLGFLGYLAGPALKAVNEMQADPTSPAEQARMARQMDKMNRESKQPTTIQVAQAPARDAAAVCGNATFTPCFINADGATCRDVSTTPIGRLMNSGNFTVTDFALQGNQCVLTVHVQGTIDGNSHARTGQVWGYVQ